MAKAPAVAESVARCVLPVARWSAWPDAQATADSRLADAPAPDVRFVDPQLRRRLGPLARMMLHVAQACAAEQRHLRLVFASTHGELGYTVALLRALAANEPLSPTTFSLSVHNAAAGLFSILRADRSESTAVAAGDATLGYALMEAFAQLDADRSRPVLVVYADASLPAEYREFADDPQDSRALALLLSADAARRLTLEWSPAGPAPRSAGALDAALLASLVNGTPGGWAGRTHAWTWH